MSAGRVRKAEVAPRGAKLVAASGGVALLLAEPEAFAVRLFDLAVSSRAPVRGVGWQGEPPRSTAGSRWAWTRR